MLTTTFDTGEKTGWAQGLNGRLTDCALIIVHDDRPMSGLPGSTGGRVVIEKPVHRRKGKTVDPNDMITLGIKVGRLKETYLVLGNTVEVIPVTLWKGGTPKDIQNRRDAAKLTAEESRLVSKVMGGIADGYRNNVWDAIGIFLWAVGR